MWRYNLEKNSLFARDGRPEVPPYFFDQILTFYILPRDAAAILAQYMLWPCVCLSVRQKSNFNERG